MPHLSSSHGGESGPVIAGKRAKTAAQVALALLVSVLFSYLAFRGVDLVSIYELMRGAELRYVAAALLAVVAGQALRSLRWGVMLEPIGPVHQNILFPISSVGFMLIVLLPARLGELARPYLLHRNSGTGVSTAMATIVLERILDSALLLLFFGVTVSALPVPEWVVHGALSLLVMMTAAIGTIAAGFALRTHPGLRRLIGNIVPPRFADRLETVMKSFYEGMTVLGKGRHALVLVLLTAGIWGIFVLSNVLLFRAFHIELGSLAAMSVLALTALGISVPAGPGFIGNFHYFCILGLSLFGIGKEQALVYAVVNHAMAMGSIVVIGTLCLYTPGLDLGFVLWRRPRTSGDGPVI